MTLSRFFLALVGSVTLALSLTSPAFAAEAADDADASQGSDEKAAKPAAEKSDGDAPAKSKEAEKPKADPFGHGGQFGLRAGLVVGYRMVFRYSDTSPYCTAPNTSKAVADQQKFCGYGAPLAADVGLSFGVADFLEPFVWARFGLAADKSSDTNPLVLVGAGVRLYTMSDAAFKIFIEPAVALEFESARGTPAWQTNDPKYGTDFVFHLAAGPQLDLHPNFGLYVTGGLSVSVLRSLASSLDLNFGLQGRYP